jgi:uncharacterized DUF497 family protein
MIQFEWDINKSRLNSRKHGISFEIAKTVFDDPLAGIIDDPIHSYNEERFLIIGYSKDSKLLVVSFTERNNKIRIISARFATKNEKKCYEERYQ